jgi:hypothetical protein
MVAIAMGAIVATMSCGGARPPTPKPVPPGPLTLAPLTAITQGPGARWVVLAQPTAVLGGPLGELAAHALTTTRQELADGLKKKLGIDFSATPDLLVARYEEATFYAVTMPSGASASTPLATLDGRLLPPYARTSPRSDIARLAGSLASGTRVSAATMGEAPSVFVAESGKFGPVLVSIALATGKLQAARALASSKPYDALFPWVTSTSAPLAWMAACPVGDAVDGGKSDGAATKAPVVLTECDGVGVTLQVLDGHRVRLRAHVTGRWGKDAATAADDLKATIERVVASDLGHALGLRDLSGSRVAVALASDATTIDAAVDLDGDRFAEGLRGLVNRDLNGVW